MKPLCALYFSGFSENKKCYKKCYTIFCKIPRNPCCVYLLRQFPKNSKVLRKSVTPQLFQHQYAAICTTPCPSFCLYCSFTWIPRPCLESSKSLHHHKIRFGFLHKSHGCFALFIVRSARLVLLSKIL